MRRPEKVAELIREEVSQIVGFELEDPRLERVTVTEVRVADNLRDARVYVVAEGTEEEKGAALKALQHAAPYVRRQLGRSLNLRYTPELHFVRDTVEESATRVEVLLSELGQDRDRHAPTGETGEERSKEGDDQQGAGC